MCLYGNYISVKNSDVQGFTDMFVIVVLLTKLF